MGWPVSGGPGGVEHGEGKEPWLPKWKGEGACVPASCWWKSFAICAGSKYVCMLAVAATAALDCAGTGDAALGVVGTAPGVAHGEIGLMEEDEGVEGTLPKVA